jgi:hypothetical protein
MLGRKNRNTRSLLAGGSLRLRSLPRRIAGTCPEELLGPSFLCVPNTFFFILAKAQRREEIVVRSV